MNDFPAEAWGGAIRRAADGQPPVARPAIWGASINYSHLTVGECVALLLAMETAQPSPEITSARQKLRNELRNWLSPGEIP